MVRPLRVLLLSWALVLVGIGSLSADTASELLEVRPFPHRTSYDDARKLLGHWDSTLRDRGINPLMQHLRPGVALPVTPADRQAVLEASRTLDDFGHGLLVMLPETAEVQREVYDWYLNHGRPGETGRWLRYNTPYLREDLIAEAEAGGGPGDVILVEKDWQAAARVIERLKESPDANQRLRAETLAFRHAPSEGGQARLLELASRLTPSDESTRSKYEVLEAIGSSSLHKEVNLAFLRDDSLYDVYTFAAWNDPEYWIPRLVAFVGHLDRKVHEHAVEVLLTFKRERARADAVEPLLPWLDDPTWSGAGPRNELLDTLARVHLPKAVPGLVKILRTSEVPQEASSAARALSHYPDPSLIPDLKAALGRETDEYRRRDFLKALLACGHFDQPTQVDALLEYVIVHDLSLADHSDESDSVRLGEILYYRAIHEPGRLQGLLEELAKRSSDLDEKSRSRVEGFLTRLDHPDVDRFLADSVASASGSALVVYAALKRRERLASQFRKNLSKPRVGSAVGFGAAILQTDPTPILRGSDVLAQRALLAAARLTGQTLPVDLVGPLIDSPAKAEALAYLAAIDSPSARSLLARQTIPKPVIYGLSGMDDRLPTEQMEQELVDILNHRAEVEEIFALFTTGYYEAYGQYVLLSFGTTGEFRWFGGGPSYRTRQLNAQEMADFKAMLATNAVEQLRKLNTVGGHSAEYQFLRLDRESGRRLYFYHPEAWQAQGRPYLALASHFKKMANQNMEVRFEAVDAVPGARILIPGSDERRVREIRGDGGRLFVCFDAPAGGAAFANSQSGLGFDLGTGSEWAVFENQKLSAVTELPWPIGPKTSHLDSADHLSLTKAGWARVGEPSPGKAALRLIDRGRTTVLVDGWYGRPVASSDGNWLACSFSPTSDWSKPEHLVLFKVDGTRIACSLEAADTLTTLTYLSTRKCFLVYCKQDDSEGFFLVSMDGKVAPMEGEFRPLLHARARQLQPRRGSQFWAALPDGGATMIGVYDTELFRFQPWGQYPSIQLTSDAIWVSEEAGIVYAVSGGSLVEFPLPRKPPGWL